MKLHIIQNKPGFASARLPDHPAGEYVYRLGTYVMSKETAQSLKGALLCLHSKKACPSQMGGTIVAIETDQPRAKGAIESGVAFIYVFDAKAKNVAADVSRWARSDWYIDERD